MLVSDLYKVIDDDVKCVITKTTRDLREHVTCYNWFELPEYVLDWRVCRISVFDNGKLYIDCK